jgi:hypothetical protein
MEKCYNFFGHKYPYAETGKGAIIFLASNIHTRKLEKCYNFWPWISIRGKWKIARGIYMKFDNGKFY